MIRNTLLCVTILLFTSGCAQTSNRKPVYAGDVLFGIGEAVLDMFDESEIDRWRRVNRDNLNRRRQWQADNSAP